MPVTSRTLLVLTLLGGAFVAGCQQREWTPPELEGVLRDLEDEDPQVRRWAAVAVGGFMLSPNSSKVVPALRTALKDEDAGVRRCAARSLRGVAPRAEAAVPDLIECLSDEDAPVRREAAWALGAIGRPARAGLPTLEQLLKDEDHEVVAAARQSIDQIRGPQ